MVLEEVPDLWNLGDPVVASDTSDAAGMTATTRVLLTGAAGVLGTWLRRHSPSQVGLVSVVHRRPVVGDAVVADLRDRRAVDSTFEAARPHLVVHAAYARDKGSIVDASRHVAEASAAVGAALVHVSTDALFSGDGLARSETDRPDPVWDYGRWKAEAEEVVLHHQPDATIVRPSLIVSLDPEDHIVADLRRGADEGSPPVWFTDELRQPASADDLARAIWAITAGAPAARAGVWHLPGPERLSRYELAARAVDALGLDRSLLVGSVTPPGLVRPRDLHLTAARAQREIGWAPRRVHEARG